MTDEELRKLLSGKLPLIRDNLLPSVEVEKLQRAVKQVLEAGRPMIQMAERLQAQQEKLTAALSPTLWSRRDGYPVNGLAYIQPWVDQFDRYYAVKTIKERLEDEDLWVEARTQGEDLHILIGDKAEGSKAHIVIDEVTGEIRVDARDSLPAGVVKKIEAVLTTNDGRQIRTVMQFTELEE